MPLFNVCLQTARINSNHEGFVSALALTKCFPTSNHLDILGWCMFVCRNERGRTLVYEQLAEFSIENSTV